MKLSKINRIKKQGAYYVDKRIGNAKQFRGSLFIKNGI